ncbi:c-type heme family protein [Reichenbachiella ulvae]|uniref:DUF3365 domain-containing protein n=1 Tax=Reichenbachiella ulvae TaxID=2980104 RepID=A0ABT3CPD0_9BACT|nr:DUF3365 domain-containing protein [Reichenbachiella ulvae]MCV9385384.1 DUF3365 domain-containing protein [Reichenbachiella ulvae]
MKNIPFTSALFLMVLLSFMLGCQSSSKEASNTDTQSIAYNEGLQIVDQNCISCHSPNANRNNRIAPPLFAVKNHYLESDRDQEPFIQSMSSFLSSPKIETSKMPRAIEKFGLMPNLGLSEEQYIAVATYLYQSNLDKPDWYEAHHLKERDLLMKNSTPGTENYLKKGMSLAQSTKAVLGKNLLTAIKTKGTDQALAFCNERAIALTDSMSNELNAKIKRVSDQNRNPENQANADELAYIAQAKEDISSSGKASPQMQEIGDKMVGYYPIMTNNMCLQCHGNPASDIDSKTLSMINSRYPNDKATGYSADQLRGIWVIEMDK